MKFDVPIQFSPIKSPVTIHLNIGYGVHCATMNDVIDKVCWQFGVPREHIFAHRKTARPVLARHVIMFICHEYLEMDHSEIAETLHFDRTASYYGVREMRGRIEVDLKLRKAVENIRDSLR